MTLQLGQVKTIVLSSPDYAKQALKSNDISFCNKRGLFAFDAENFSKNSLVWIPIGHQWRHIRKFCNIHILSTARMVASQHLRRNKMKDLLVFVENCSKSSQVIDIGQLVFGTSLNLLSTTCFSEDLGDPDSEIAINFKKAVKAAMEEGGKINFADYFPFLRRFDLQGGKRRMSVHLRTMIQIFNDMIEKRADEIEHKLDSTQDCVDILDVLLRMNPDSKDHFERSKIPYLLMGHPIAWVSVHRYHHQFADSDKDLHSPMHGFWFSQLTWLFHTQPIAVRPAEQFSEHVPLLNMHFSDFGVAFGVPEYGEANNVKDLEKEPFYRFLRSTYIFHVLLLGLLLYALGGFPYLVWGIGVRFVYMTHVTGLVNSVCHVWGNQIWNTGDLSKNNWWVALLTFGEGWHNNHHAFPYSARHGLEWWQIDVTWFIVKFLQLLGLATDVKLPIETHKQRLTFGTKKM